ncbi:hypothetical protein MPSEU_000511800 [Mayamaea pseudoterrestris]|nr:hypothetical protein MPSEU_000511800 [Mayamaea pseudoterrestris]
MRRLSSHQTFVHGRMTSRRMTSGTFDADEFAVRQQQLSRRQQLAEATKNEGSIENDEETNSANASNTEKSKFLNHQRSVFDEFASYFASDEAVPPEVEPALRQICTRIIDQQVRHGNQESQQQEEQQPIRILDVACGTGVLHSYFLEAAGAARSSRPLHITGLDLSPNMITKARERRHDNESLSNAKIDFVVSDILQYMNDETDESSKYDAVVMNACFGNFMEPRAVLKHVANNLLKLGGTLIISHPLGASFVAKLHEESPETVPHLLPDSRLEFQNVILNLPLEIDEYLNESPACGSSTNDHGHTLYFASARKVRYRALAQVIRLRGTVDTGYGRGGKKLGFPTANLPSSLFRQAIQDLDTGVYFGWAVIENGGGDASGDGSINQRGRNVPQKAVVNIGYSPTFAGQENLEKIVEAHLMLEQGDEDGLDDFYGAPMRLQLLAYLRPEIKFASFPDLIAQIKADVQDSKAALDTELYLTMSKDVFLRVEPREPWVGSDGGDESASWEYQEFRQALDDCGKSNML